jgi:hypothetical protein
MDLVGAWLRQLLRAGTAAAIVPAAMVGALVVVLVGAGGFGGLGSLRQVFVGPEISPAHTPESGAHAPDIAPIAPPARRATVRRAVAPAAPRRVAPGEVAPTVPAPRRPPAVVTPPSSPGPSVLPPPPAAAPAPPASPPSLPEPATTPAPPAIEQTTQQLVDGVDQTLDSVGELLVTIIGRLGRLLPPPRR